MRNLINSPKKVLLLFCLLFFLIPFFWLKPGEMDLGGDSSRLYFYDPLAYLKSFSLFSVVPEGMGVVQSNQYFLPFLLLLEGIKFFVQTPNALITVFNIIKLFGGFLAMYFVILEILNFTKTNLKNEKLNTYAAFLGGLFYILSPISTGNWDKALTSHFQIFLNPLMFFLLLRFFVTHNLRYAWIGLFISILFAPNFAITSAPPFFAFYPLAIIFLILFMLFQKVKFPSWRKIIVICFSFFGLHAFHLIPIFVSLFEPGSFTNTRVFDKESIAHEGIRYFYGILPLAKVSQHLLLPTLQSFLNLFFVVVPMVIVTGFFINRKNRALLLTGVFFLVTLYLLSANITQAGVKFYESLFYVPGFSMFRNFIGQWAMVYIFFYALLFAQAIRIIVNKFPKLNYSYVVLAIGLLFIFASWRFISGDAVRKGYVTNNVEIPIQMDQDYEQTLEYIRTLPDDSKMLMLPYTDAFYQVLAGENGGAYVGPSTIAYLTGRKTFTGYQTMPAEFSEKFLALAREKDYEEIKRFFGYLNIKYLFYNADSQVYDNVFSGGPYTYMRESLPKTQAEYQKFIPHIVEKEIFHRGTYHIFTFSDDIYMPLFYTESEKEQTPDIFFKRVNPTRYKVFISNAEDSYDLIFLNQYHPQWRIFLSDTPRDSLQTTVVYGNHAIQEGKHEDQFFVNPFETIGLKEIAYTKHTDIHDYANSWRITPEDVDGKKNYTVIVEMTNQRIFYMSLIVSTIVFVVFIGWGFRLFFPVRIIGIIRQINGSEK